MVNTVVLAANIPYY